MNALRVWSEVDEVRMWLLCLPPGGGSARLFKGWADLLPTGLGVATLELPGRGGRQAEPPATSLEGAVTEFADAAAPLLERPVMLFGHSMGAVLALDLAYELRARRGWKPVALVAAASEPPEQRTVSKSSSDASDEELMTWLRGLGGTSEELLASREFLDEMLPALRADLQLVERRRQRAEPPLDCPLHVYLGARDPTVDGPAAERLWATHTTREQPPRTFPGGHFFVQESVELVLAALAEDANAAVGGRLMRSG
ncbi:thioesterase II family protein [Streptomyces doebereineriae]|uniref:Alpha/beta fold hydrolase n=1 Tax=Streptomyces doebereineriae TaxID=3075528 RepID=A0ABU2VBG7_9ACTN|nr:alpha/beta fold hydrolase [Streptomyces sp. DSM 41640]MDT0482759.1 alpha/beta fold hydrolase [Streptomyces sp. DSM 41640]